MRAGWLAIAVALVAVACGGARDVADDPTVSAEPSASEASAPAEAAVAPNCEDLEVPAEVDGPLSDDPDVARAQQARAESGLPSDEATVRHVMETTDPKDWVFPFPHTDAEFDKLMNGDPGGGQKQALTQYVRSQPETYAGHWTERAGWTRFVVAFTDDLDRHRAALEELGVHDVEVIQYEHTEAELFRVHEAASDLLQGDDRGPLFSVGMPVIPNRVSLGVEDPTPADLRRLSDEFGADMICFEEGSPPSHALAPRRGRPR